MINLINTLPQVKIRTPLLSECIPSSEMQNFQHTAEKIKQTPFDSFHPQQKKGKSITSMMSQHQNRKYDQFSRTKHNKVQMGYDYLVVPSSS